MALSSLVIVESPAKAKTINKILGKEYLVKASLGHIMDLPQKRLGVDEKKDFTPEYVTIPGKEKVIKDLRQAAKGMRQIYVATDPDREGEAIASHIADVLGKDGEIYRVVFNEITERAVREAFQHAGKIDRNKVDAQQARRVLDRLVGYNLSPLLWKKIRRGLSAGRVQSVALRLVVDREREIEAFVKEEYWSLDALLEGPVPPRLSATLFKYEGAPVIDRDAPEGKRFLITGEEKALGLTEALGKEEFVVGAVEKKLRKRTPYPPFITSTLQQEAARKLGFAAKRTMQLAQNLYEGIELGEKGAVGLITYMRTDSVRVASEAQQWARLFIEKTYGRQFVPEKPPVYKSRASAQEAHEAVRPTYEEYSPEAVKPYLSRDHMRLYTLIWNRFISSQMKPAMLEQTTVDISAGAGALFRASGSVIKFTGFMAVYTETREELEALEEEEGRLLPPAKEGDILGLLGLTPKQHFTQPPPRFTEASLVKTLEEKGIGRPSTYATILSTITDRKYVHKEQGRFAATELGTIVNDYLVEKFPALLDVGFTAKMEYELDHIEDGRFKWAKVVKDFYKPFSESLSEAAQAQGKVKPQDIATDVACEKCGSPMVIRWGRHGRFLACTAYPKCKNTRPLEGEEPKTVPTNEVCEKCGSPMVLKTGRFGKFLACSKYPECKNTRPLPTGVKCPEDGGDIVARRARGGRTFWSCGNYPNCKFTIWSKPVPEKCPKCGAEFLLIKKDTDGSLIRFCHKKDCGFQEQLKAEDAA